MMKPVMKPMMPFLLPLSLVIFLLLVLAGPREAHAHGTASRVLEEAKMVAIEFSYSDGEPMRYAEVLVFSPEDQKVEHQNARTDRHGRVAFCPDTPGTWLITANDGMGHLSEARVEVDPGPLSQEAEQKPEISDPGQPGPASKTLKTLFGLSLILNLALGVHFFYRRSNRTQRRS